MTCRRMASVISRALTALPASRQLNGPYLSAPFCIARASKRRAMGGIRVIFGFLALISFGDSIGHLPHTGLPKAQDAPLLEAPLDAGLDDLKFLQ